MNILGTDAWKSAWTLNKNELWVEYYYCCYCPSKDRPTHHHMLTHLAAHLSLIHPSFSHPSIHQPLPHSFLHEAHHLAKHLAAYSSFHEMFTRHPPTYPPIHPSSICPSTHLPTDASIIYLSTHPPTYLLYTHLLISPFTHPSTHQLFTRSHIPPHNHKHSSLNAQSSAHSQDAKVRKHETPTRILTVVRKGKPTQSNRLSEHETLL